MSDLNDWANTEAGNDRTPLPDYLKENQTPVPAVNDWAREAQAAVRRFFETLEWRNFLGNLETPTQLSATSFDLPASKVEFYHQDQRIRVKDDTAYGVGVFEYGVITDVTGQTVTVQMDNAVDIFNTIEEVAVGLDPTNQPVTIQAIHNFTEELATALVNSDDYMRRLDGDPITATFATTTTCTIPAANRYNVWLEARIDITDSGMSGGVGIGYISGIAFGAIPDVDDTTITIVEDAAQNLTTGLSSIEIITPTKNDALIVDSRGQARGAGIPLASIEYGETALGANWNNGASHGEALAHGMSATPQLVRWVLECTIAEEDYSIGDQVEPVTDNNDTVNNAEKLVISNTADDTNVYIGAHFDNGANLRIVRKDGTARFEPLTANWEWRAHCWAFLGLVSIP